MPNRLTTLVFLGSLLACACGSSEQEPAGEGWAIGESGADETDLEPPPSSGNNGESPSDDDVSITPARWELLVDDFGVGVHTIWMLVDVQPMAPSDVTKLSASLIWPQTQIELCASIDPDDFITIRGQSGDALVIGDGFQSNEQGPGCSINAAMADAFATFGLPDEACVWVETTRGDLEYCAPLTVIGI